MSELFPGLVLPTTVVGSYPVVKGMGISRLFDPYRHAVKIAVADQLAVGIDIISDGQVRGDMVNMFTGLIPGIKGNEVIGPVSPASGPITVSDTRYALSEASRVKGIITGPTTLSFALHITTPTYRNREELALDLSRVLAREAELLEAAGVTLIQIDEPILSTGITDIRTAADAIHNTTRGLSIPICLHVCGDISSILHELLSFPVSILDFEFARSPANLSLCREFDFGKKMVGFGCVDSANPFVEPVSLIRERIGSALTVFSPEKLLIDPDCGLRMLTRETAVQKLGHMVEAVQSLRKDL